MDRLKPKRRSALMSRIAQKNTKPELAVRSLLHGIGLRFRLHAKDLPGRPDIVNRKKRFAVFVHGCFWHGHSCPRGKRPTSNVDFWNTKLSRNKKRDITAAQSLRRNRWTVVTVWECQLKNPNRLLRLLRPLLKL